MDFEEHAGKALLTRHGIGVPPGRVAATAEAAEVAAGEIGPCVVKAQVPTGKRGKAGGIRLANTPEEARKAAEAILALEIDGHPVRRLLIEGQVAIEKELYAAVMGDPASRGPVILFSPLGGMDVEEAAEKDPGAMRTLEVDIAKGPQAHDVMKLVEGLELKGQGLAISKALVALYDTWRSSDAELLEVNPLALTVDGRVMALDCKLSLDDASAPRQPELAAEAAPERRTELEEKAAEAGLKYIELGGSVGVLANGAGLTMTTMDAIAHYGGRPSNFLEIGGEAYTKAEVALTILLGNPNIRSLLVNFCGAFARTDVMAGGVVEAWKRLRPDIPVFFSIHGTGEDEAVALVKRELGLEPFDLMDDAVKAAVEAAQGGRA